MSTRAFLGLLGVGGGKDADAATVSENELRLIIGSAKQSGAVEPDEQARLKPPSPLHIMMHNADAWHADWNAW